MNDHRGDCLRRGKSEKICKIHPIIDVYSQIIPGCGHRVFNHTMQEIVAISKKMAKGNRGLENQYIAEGKRHIRDDMKKNRC